jgi:hypothetical protein
MPPGSYSHNEKQEPATIAVNKAGQGVGDQKQTASKLRKRAHSIFALQKGFLKWSESGCDV